MTQWRSDAVFLVCPSGYPRVPAAGLFFCMHPNDISQKILECAFAIHYEIGSGIFECVYEAALDHELRERGLQVERQKRVPFTYKGMRFRKAFRADLIVQDTVLIEVKSVPAITPTFEKQVQTYLRLLDLRLGLILNFGAPLMKDGIKRVVNGL